MTTENQVATTASSLPASPDALLKGLANVTQANQIDRTEGADSFMKFVKGYYMYGAEETPVQPNSLWAVNPSSLVHGYQAWGDSKLLGEEVASMGELPVLKANLPEYRFSDPDLVKHREQQVAQGVDADKLIDPIVVAEWQVYRGFSLVCTNGEDEGTECFLASTSKGFTRAFTKLVGAIIGQMDVDPGNPVPVVLLDTDSYDHRKYGETFVPVFNVQTFVGMEATVVPEPEGEAEQETEVESAQSTAPTPDASAPEPEQDRHSRPGRKSNAPAPEPVKPEPTAARRQRQRRPAA